MIFLFDGYAYVESFLNNQLNNKIKIVERMDSNILYFEFIGYDRTKDFVYINAYYKNGITFQLKYNYN